MNLLDLLEADLVGGKKQVSDWKDVVERVDERTLQRSNFWHETPDNGEEKDVS